MDAKKNFSIVSVERTLHGTRLDKFLLSQFPEYSRSYFQQLIDAGHVLVNEHASKTGYCVKEGDSISVHFKTAAYSAIPIPIAFEVIDEHEDFVVINKPAGLVVHHSSTAPEAPSLVSGLLYRFQEIAKIDDSIRPGIVHRLDKDTSGLLLVARHQLACMQLAAMFKQHQVSKTYLAVVSGHPDKKGSIDLPIGRHVSQRHKMSVGGICPRQALTHYQLIEQYDQTALLAATIVTGRTHQIRVHCAAIGHGIIGDKTYGVASELIARQALHAWKLSFSWKGQQYSYTCNVPDDMKILIKDHAP